MAQYSILIADNDPQAFQFLSGTLKANGFLAAGTSSARSALEQYKANPPDLVLAEMSLPDLDGMQLLEELLRFDPKARVIITTAYADKDLVARAFRMGALEILEKPLDPAFLVSKIRDLLAREDRGLEGDLQLMSLASIIQINCEERNQALLELNRFGEEGRIYFRDGEMIHATAAGLIGDDALYHLLGWEQGRFRLKMGQQPDRRTIYKPWSGLLLEGMRRLDETTAEWTPEWMDEPAEEEDAPTGEIEGKIVRALANLRDVNSALIFGPDGELIAQQDSQNPEDQIDLGLFLVEKTELISGFVSAGALERIVLSGSGQRIYFQPQDDKLLVLELSLKSSAESLSKSVQTILKRYQTA